MDERFFFKAMEAVPTIVVDTMENNDEKRIEVLSKATYTARTDYVCIYCGRAIKRGMHYARVVVKPEDEPVQTQRFCLPCWLD